MMSADERYSMDGVGLNMSTLNEGVRSSDLELLKTNSVKCITDTLLKKLLDLEEVGLCISIDSHKVTLIL